MIQFGFKGLQRYTYSLFGPTEVQLVFKGLRLYGGSIRFQGPVKIQFVLRAYGAVVQFGFRGLQRYTYSLFGPTEVQFVFKGLRRYSFF